MSWFVSVGSVRVLTCALALWVLMAGQAPAARARDAARGDTEPTTEQAATEQADEPATTEAEATEAEATEPEADPELELPVLSVEVDEDEAVALHRQGLEAQAAGDLDGAIELLQQATARAPNDLLIGTDYRQAVIARAETLDTKRGQVKKAYERCVKFFAALAKAYPDAPNAHLNYGFSMVDKIPAEGAITRVILANDSLTEFGKALELDPSWLGYYSRGHAYLFWPPIFGRVEMGIADLERAVAIAKEAGDHQPYYARAWAALGDGFWRLDNVEQARQVWQQAAAVYPDDAELQARLEREDRAKLDAYLETHYDTGVRVGTHLHEIYGDRLAEVSPPQAADGETTE